MELHLNLPKKKVRVPKKWKQASSHIDKNGNKVVRYEADRPK